MSQICTTVGCGNTTPRNSTICMSCRKGEPIAGDLWVLTGEPTYLIGGAGSHYVEDRGSDWRITLPQDGDCHVENGDIYIQDGDVFVGDESFKGMKAELEFQSIRVRRLEEGLNRLREYVAELEEKVCLLNLKEKAREQNTLIRKPKRAGKSRRTSTAISDFFWRSK